MQITASLQKALSDAVYNQTPLSDLEFLGASPRTLSILDESGYVTIAQILNSSKERLYKVKSLDKKTIDDFIDCIMKLDQLKSYKERLEKVGPVGYVDEIKKLQEEGLQSA
jgi:DNA-directed RNA polymerase alpha subunit